jgi:hypothetical protein
MQAFLFVGGGLSIKAKEFDEGGAAFSSPPG